MRKGQFFLSLTPAACISSPQMPKGVGVITRRKQNVAKGQGNSGGRNQVAGTSNEASDGKTGLAPRSPSPGVQLPHAKAH